MREYAAAYDDVSRSMKLEQEEFTGLKRAEVGRGGGPEVHLVKIGPMAQRVEPIAVSHRYDEVDAHSLRGPLRIFSKIDR